MNLKTLVESQIKGSGNVSGKLGQLLAIKGAITIPGSGIREGFLPSAYAVGNNFSRVCLSVCLSVYLSVCVSVQITFELLKVGTSFLVYTYIFIISRSSLSTKVIGSRSRSND